MAFDRHYRAPINTAAVVLGMMAAAGVGFATYAIMQSPNTLPIGDPPAELRKLIGNVISLIFVFGVMFVGRMNRHDWHMQEDFLSSHGVNIRFIVFGVCLILLVVQSVLLFGAISFSISLLAR